MAYERRQKLKALLNELRDLQLEARRCGHELNGLELALGLQKLTAEISEFTYHIRQQQIARSRATIHDALQKLQAQRTEILSILENY